MNEFMNEAIKLSIDNLHTKDGGPFGACVVKDGVIIGKGSNRVILENDPTAHAEIVAIREACKKIESFDLSGCELYTSCYPCPMCLSAIIWSNIKCVYYGNTVDDSDSIGFRDKEVYEYIRNMNSNDSILKLECINPEESILAFKEYSSQEDKVKY